MNFIAAILGIIVGVVGLLRPNDLDFYKSVCVMVLLMSIMDLIISVVDE